MSLDDVKKYYAVFDEWARLERPMGRLEFERAMMLLDRFLSGPCRILDLGAGPGRYAIALAKRGHRVTLADLSSAQLEIARARVAEARVGDLVDGFCELNATDLSRFGDGTFDAVVAFGPFYHLIEADDRKQVASEMARVVPGNGLVFAAFIPPYFHATHLISRALASPEQVCKENFIECLEQQVFINRHDTGFQEGYFAFPAEMASLLESAGLEMRLTASLRGFANGYEEQLYALAEQNPELFKAVMDALDRTSTVSSIVETSGHALAVAQKPADRALFSE